MTRPIQTSAVLTLLSALSAFPLSGCYVRASAVPPPEVAYEAEAEPPPPPAAEVEVVPASPGPEFLWLSGYHRWNGRHYVWVRGRYERRPRREARWMAPHWEARGRAHVWVEGRWE